MNSTLSVTQCPVMQVSEYVHCPFSPLAQQQRKSSLSLSTLTFLGLVISFKWTPRSFPSFSSPCRISSIFLSTKLSASCCAWSLMSLAFAALLPHLQFSPVCVVGCWWYSEGFDGFSHEVTPALATKYPLSIQQHFFGPPPNKKAEAQGLRGNAGMSCSPKSRSSAPATPGRAGLTRGLFANRHRPCETPGTSCGRWSSPSAERYDRVGIAWATADWQGPPLRRSLGAQEACCPRNPRGHGVGRIGKHGAPHHALRNA
mmetsp:Transcript_78750/g.222637  ORF Transcript_78750/g.222637 Transcript_78750/m.222637 type:complete len:258 (+) Transcript_78750:290-1063(+)